MSTSLTTVIPLDFGDRSTFCRGLVYPRNIPVTFCFIDNLPTLIFDFLKSHVHDAVLF